MQGKDICFLHMDEKSGLSQTDVQNSVSTFFQLSMQWSVQPENHLDLTRSKLNMDHFQRSRFMTNIREKYDTLRISQNWNLFLIWFLDYSSRCESSWCILGPSWYTSKKIRSIWLCWGCSSYQKQTYRYTRRFQDGLSVTLRFFDSFFVHFFDKGTTCISTFDSLHHPIGVLFVFLDLPFRTRPRPAKMISCTWYPYSQDFWHFFSNHHSAFIKIDEKYAERAVESLNNCYFFGKQIKVQFSKQNPNSSSSSSNQVLSLLRNWCYVMNNHIVTGITAIGFVWYKCWYCDHFPHF